MYLLFKKSITTLLTWLSLSILAAPPLWAATQNDLHMVKKAISDTQTQIRNTSTERKKIDSSLAQTNSQLNHAQNELNALNRQHQNSVEQLSRLQHELEKTQTRIDEIRTQISRLLNAHYRNRQPNGISLLLNNNNLDQKGRTLEYLRYINISNEKIIETLQQQQQQLIQQQKKLTSQQHQLSALQKKQQTLIKKLNQVHHTQLQQSSSLDKQLSLQNKKLQKLRNDEKRMNRLLAQLAQAKAQKKKLEMQKRRQAEKNKPRVNAPSNAGSPQPAESANNSFGLTAEDRALRADNNQIHTTVSFVSQQGQLFKPVNAPITNYFGSSRAGGGVWKGLFFATNPAPVHSIAQGKVIYASNLEGYGKTVILDHDDGYLSIYTGLSEIFVSSGAKLSAGQTLGKSGQLPENKMGLYFEIRYHNQPMNPLSWLN